jgi:N-acetylneuraminate synthase/N,N'-diacetyllegionaminate synthase
LERRVNVKIGKHEIAGASPVYFIAEAGVNHNGDLALAKKLIDAAAEAGADCVKFQTFRASEIVTAEAPKAAYQLLSTDKRESQHAMLEKLELPKSSFKELMEHCRKARIQFLSTPYNYGDVDLLDDLGVDAFKIASGQLTETPFLQYVAKKKKPVILSSGMATMADVREAVAAVGKTPAILLQCTTDYPAREADANLNVLTTFQQSFDIPIGYSDHTVGDVAILGAVALGARVIEKHFTLDKKMVGPDHACSIEPHELKDLISRIRLLEKALGSREKFPSDSEKKNAAGMKRSLVARQKIRRGDVFKAEKPSCLEIFLNLIN